MNDNELDTVMKSIFGEQEHVADNGFAAGVMVHLPPRRPPYWLRATVLSASALLSCALLPALGVDMSALARCVADGFSAAAAGSAPSAGAIVLLGLLAAGTAWYMREAAAQ